MRLYLKLAIMSLVALGAQAVVSTGTVGDTYFAIRCYVANVSGDRELEHSLVRECEKQFAAQNSRALLAASYNVSAAR